MKIDILNLLSTPFLPNVFEDLLQYNNYSEKIIIQLFPSIDTQGFINNAMYINDMSLGPVEDIIEVNQHRVFFEKNEFAYFNELIHILDIFQYQQPQMLLILAALQEAFNHLNLGGKGDKNKRKYTENEFRNKKINFSLLNQDEFIYKKEFKEIFETNLVPDLYLGIAKFNDYLNFIWEHLKHLYAFPEIRKRSRGLYYYALSSSKYFAYTIKSDLEYCLQNEIDKNDIEEIQLILQSNLFMYSIMIMHCTAMRVGLGYNKKLVVKG